MVGQLLLIQSTNQGLAKKLARVRYTRHELPAYFLGLQSEFKLYESWEHGLTKVLKAVLKNNRLYRDRMEDRAGSVLWADYFFCATIDDADLPWDCNQTDW